MLVCTSLQKSIFEDLPKLDEMFNKVQIIDFNAKNCFYGLPADAQVIERILDDDFPTFKDSWKKGQAGCADSAAVLP